MRMSTRDWNGEGVDARTARAWCEGEVWNVGGWEEKEAFGAADLAENVSHYLGVV